MRKNTRQNILDTARDLFNNRGFNAVSLQEIADAVGISKGNLTYHFKRKEDLMEALLLENQKKELPASIRTLEDLDTLFLTMQQVVGQHSYYFLNYAQLSQSSEIIAGMQKKNVSTIRNLLLEGLRNLQETGFLRKEEFSGEYDGMVDILCMANIYWEPFSVLQQSLGRQTDYRHHAWGILYGLLTEEGRQIAVNKFVNTGE